MKIVRLSAWIAASVMAMACGQEEEEIRDLQQIYHTGEALMARWDMEEPDIQYDQASDIFTFTFLTASADNYDAGMITSFWDVRCKDTLDGVNKEISHPMILDGNNLDSGAAPNLKMESVNVDELTGSTDQGTKLLPQMKFKIDTVLFVDTLQDNAYDAQPLYIVGDASGRVEFCVRNGIGYTTTPEMDGSTFTSGYQEVNFIETLVIIEYDLSAGFDVDAFQVGPKDRQGTTQQEDYSDSLEAYLCIGSQSPEYDASVHADEFNTVENNSVVSYYIPKKLTGYEDGGANKFNQGALINICIKVKDEYLYEGLRLDGIDRFDFLRTSPQAVLASQGLPDTLVQECIVGKAPSPNFLTSYNHNSCINVPVCDFASVLFAQFYATPGLVSGDGQAQLRFYNDGQRRGLREKHELPQLQNQRRLQGSSSVMVEIPVSGPDASTRPPLKTAGSVSPGKTFTASALALVCTLLLV